MNYAEKKLKINNAWAKLLADRENKTLTDEYHAALQTLTFKQTERLLAEDQEEEWALRNEELSKTTPIYVLK